jgi:hypothetical protein
MILFLTFLKSALFCGRGEPGIVTNLLLGLRCVGYNERFFYEVKITLRFW